MNRKVKGSLSIILIILVSIISIAIYYINSVNEQNISIVNYSSEKNQASYICDAYIMLSEKILTNEIDNEIDLFNELDYTKNNSISEISVDSIPFYETISTINYKNIEISKKGRFTKYNEILFKSKAVLNENNLEKNELSKFLILKSNYINNNKYELYNSEIIKPNNSLRIGSNYILPILYEYSDGKSKPLFFLNEFFIYEFQDDITMGDEEYKGNVNLNGIFFIDANISLDTNLILNGIIVSNSGSINTNGYSCSINGLLIEFGEGSYPGVDIKYNKNYLLSTLKYLPWTKDVNLEYIVQIN